MKEQETFQISNLFVRVFNQILAWEEQSFKTMGFSDITLRELHVLEAVFGLIKEENNKMSEIAKYLSITPGSLTTAVNGLVKKGYLVRESKLGDRRVVLIVPTEKAVQVNDIHSKMRSGMIDEVLSHSSDNEKKILFDMLGNLTDFFAEKQNTRK